MSDPSISPASLTFAVSLDSDALETEANEVPAEPTSLPVTDEQPEEASEEISEMAESLEPQLAPEPILLKDIPVRLKAEGSYFRLILPPEGELTCTWVELSQQIQVLLKGSELLKNLGEAKVPVYLLTRDRLLDSRQLQAISDILAPFHLQLERVETQRRQTAIAAVTCGYSVEQITASDPLKTNPSATVTLQEDPLYLQTTLRSGVEIRHPGTIIIQGDINPGASAIADGDIVVWGRLRGVAHAGSAGNPNCTIMALDMEPTQIRIAGQVARTPKHSLPKPYPEVAYATPEGIRIAAAMDFPKVRYALVTDNEEV